MLVLRLVIGDTSPSRWSARLLLGLTAAAMALMAVPSMQDAFKLDGLAHLKFVAPFSVPPKD